jgi:hypothetical protein
MTKLRKLNLDQRFPQCDTTTLRTVDSLVNALFAVSTRFSYWESPHISFDREEECISLEWRNRERAYKVYVLDGTRIQYVAIVESEQRRGNSLHLNNNKELKEFWKWISFDVSG